MDLNITALVYMLMRLSPLLIVVMIVLSSVLLGDMRGLAYIIGLCLAVLGPTVLLGAPSGRGAANAACNLITVQGVTIGGNAALSQLVLGFSFFFLLYSTTKFNITRPSRNLYLVVLFPVLIIFDALYSTNNQCIQYPHLLLSLAYGSSAGVFWAYFLHKTGLPHLTFFSNDGQIPHCSMPSRQSFKCRVYQNGQLIG